MTTLYKNIIGRLPSKNLLPLLISFAFDSLSISTFWIFFGIWLNEEILTKEAGYNYPYLMLAIVLALPGFVSIFANSLFSIISDKTGRRKEIMFGSRILLASQLVLLIFFGKDFWSILLIYILGGSHTIYYIMNSALITSICSPEKKGEVSSYQMLFASGGWMVGSLFAGSIYKNLGMGGSLAIGACLALCCGVISLFSPTEPVSNPKTTQFIARGLQELKIDSTHLPLKRNDVTYKDIILRSNVLKMLLVLAIVDLSFGPFNSMASVYLKTVGLDENFIAWSNTVATFIGMTIQLFIGQILDKKGRRPVFIAAIAGYPVLFTLVYAFQRFWVMNFILYCYPLYALKVPASNAIMADLTSENERGRGMSLIQFEQIIFLSIGSFVGAYLADLSKKGLLILPLFPIIIGAVALILAISIIKETNPLLNKEEIQNQQKIKNSL